MEPLDTVTIARRSIRGVLALTTRTIFIQAIGFVAFLILSFSIDKSAFGVYSIVQAVISFLVYFSDIGLAGALIQKKEDLTQDDLKSTFTIQQILVGSIVLITLFATPYISKFYSLDKPGTFLLQSLTISFFLSSLKTIPSVLLERKLDFQKLVLPQIFETIVYNSIAVVLALNGFGITSFSYAVLARGLIGVIVLYSIAPWKIEFGIDKKSVKKLLSFGVPFQMNSFLALLKDDLLTIFLGRILTHGEIGTIGFSQKWAFYPLRIALDNVIRITFPSFSRLQDNAHALRVGIEKSIFVILTLVTPLLTGFVILFPYITHLIPRYSQWQDAWLPLAFFAGNAILSSISTPLTNLLNAIGKIRITLMLMVFWLVTTWVATLVGIHFFGFTGVAIASFIVSLSVILVVIITRRYVYFTLTKPVLPPLVASAIMGIVVYYSAGYLVKDVPTFFVVVVLGGISYLGSLYMIAGKELRADIVIVRRLLQKVS